ncbi:MAG: hypothetical protein G01um101444_373 [Parcubacteria group bacterium Gr01-1014_44]|nr:MAG: hypothetical protein G01um101444_373 [Parcubacteria group bacterium Gr01-1014_44]
MPKHGTALTSGQQAEFLKTGIGALTLLSHDPNLDSTIADGWAKNGEAMLRGFVRLIIPPLPDPTNGIVKTSVIVIGGGRTTDQIVADAKKLEGKNRLNHINNADITQEHMPSGNGRKRSVIVEWFEFDREPLTEEVRARCEEPGYGYSTYEDGLRFQEDHPDDQRERPHIIIPENPWYDANGDPRALDLWGSDDERELYLDYCWSRSRWLQGCVFARRKYV